LESLQASGVALHDGDVLVFFSFVSCLKCCNFGDTTTIRFRFTSIGPT